jgi:hydroxypyruvate isomerase
MKNNPQCVNYFSRRQMLAGVAAAGAMAASGVSLCAEDKVEGKPAAVNGKINQSVVHWCFSEYWDIDKTAAIAKQLGCKSVELVAPETWPTLKKHGITCAISPSHLFVQGMNNPKYHAPCVELLKTRIDQAAEAGVPTVITFTGFAADTGEWAGGNNPDLAKIDMAKAKKIDREEGLKNCVEGFKKIVGHAEKKKVNLSIEMLNTREDTHPMKGHPGYQGDHVDYCMYIIKQVGSPRFGLLFDIYHVQIMDGDIIRRIRQCGEAINHVHTAGNPGRGEIDASQEINYPPCMKALVDIGYKGYVGQEFIPTRDPLVGLTEAVKLCDVA